MSLKTPIRLFLEFIASLCGERMHTFALGLGIGLMCVSFWNAPLAKYSFLALVVVPIACAVLFLERERKIRMNSRWWFLAGCACGSSAIATIVILGFYNFFG